MLNDINSHLNWNYLYYTPKLHFNGITILKIESQVDMKMRSRVVFQAVETVGLLDNRDFNFQHLGMWASSMHMCCSFPLWSTGYLNSFMFRMQGLWVDNTDLVRISGSVSTPRILILIAAVFLSFPHLLPRVLAHRAEHSFPFDLIILYYIWFDFNEFPRRYPISFHFFLSLSFSPLLSILATLFFVLIADSTIRYTPESFVRPSVLMFLCAYWPCCNGPVSHLHHTTPPWGNPKRAEQTSWIESKTASYLMFLFLLLTNNRF